MQNPITLEAISLVFVNVVFMASSFFINLEPHAAVEFNLPENTGRNFFHQ